MVLYITLAILFAYILLSLSFTYLAHQMPRKPIKDPPDWGRISDFKIASVDGGVLEVWKIEPERPTRGTVLLAHGWSRNRDRMVQRAKIFGQMGFTTVIHSARDHGKSTRHRFMNAFRFAEDIESVLKWIDEPVLLYGHSAGAAGAIIATSLNPEKIRVLFLEGCYARTKEALRSLYKSYNLFFGIVFGPAVVFWMDIFYRFRLDRISPVKLAPKLDMPVLLIHGEKDKSFALSHAWRLKESFPNGNAEIFIGRDADHSSSSLTPEYPGIIKDFINRHYYG